MASGLVRTSVLSVKQASQSKTHKYLNKRNREYFCNQRIRKDKDSRPPHTSTLPEGRASATRPQLAPCDSRKRAMADSQALTRTSRPGPAWQSPWPWPASALRTSAKPAGLKTVARQGKACPAQSG